MVVYCPDAVDIIWLDFLQSVANEQAGRRPAFVLSPLAFNQLNGRCIARPIARRDHDWSFPVQLPDSDEISGVVQTDQLRSASWEQRGRVALASVLDECSRFDMSCNAAIASTIHSTMLHLIPYELPPRDWHRELSIQYSRAAYSEFKILKREVIGRQGGCEDQYIRNSDDQRACDEVFATTVRSAGNDHPL